MHGAKQSSIDVAPSNQQASPKSMAGKLVGRYKNAPERRMNTRHLAGQNIPHHKPAKFPKDKPIKHLGSKSAF